LFIAKPVIQSRFIIHNMKELSFIAVDVETATPEMSSICQVGYVMVINNLFVKQESILIQPPNNEYSARHSCIHGIDALTTKAKPTFPFVWEIIQKYFCSNLLVAHNASFDISVLSATIKHYGIALPLFNYECTYQSTGLKLTDLCQALEIELPKHHDALFDAVACANAYIKLVNGIKPNHSLITKRENENIFLGHEHITGQLLKPDLESGDKSHPFYNKKVVFTGVLDTISREEAATIVKSKGADIDTGITKNTQYVIVGHGAGPVKLKKIENFNTSGSDIKILNEKEFLNIIKQDLSE
jgi:DNA polymerase III subunit epsilon